MPAYYPDTNILIGFGREIAVRNRLERSVQNGTRFVVAPPVLVELVRSMVKAGQAHFDDDK